MIREFYIARGVTELGPLTQNEVRELLRDGFLLPADLYWEAGMAKWAELHEFDSAQPPAPKGAALDAFAERKISSVGKSAAARAADLTRKLQSLVGRGQNRLSSATGGVLDSFSPQIQKLVARQLVQQSVVRVQEAVHDDEFMRKFFGAIYDCLPKPVYRFVTEQAFIRYCMKRRLRMLGLDTAKTDP